MQMSYTSAEGKQLPTRQHGEGDVFGASGLLDAGSGTRRDTATALTPVTLKVIPHEDVKRSQGIMRHNSILAEAGAVGLGRACSGDTASVTGAKRSASAIARSKSRDES